MTLSLLDLLLIGAYFAVITAVGFAAGRGRGGGSTEFLLAGRSLTTPVFVMTLVSTWYGGILGVGEFSYLYGISNWVIQGGPYYLFAVCFALLLAGRIRETGCATIPDVLEKTYGRRPALAGAMLTFVLMSPAPYLLMLAVLLQMITGWPMLLCLAVGAAATAASVAVVGFRADVLTDVVEFVLMFAGFAVILPFAFVRFGGMAFLSSHLPPLHLSWHGGNSPQFIGVWFLIALWTLVDPTFHQRCFAARSARVARNGILISVVFWFLFDAMTAFAGLYARAILPPLDRPMLAFPLLAEALLPPGMKGLFVIGMLATVMSTLNSLLFVSATTLGRDLYWRWRGEADPAREVHLTRLGLLATGLGAIVLAEAIPSVVRLWYVIGTAVVPGLLLPVVAGYFGSVRPDPATALRILVVAPVVSVGWLLAGWCTAAVGEPFLGIEPMFPGLLVALALWGWGWTQGRGRERRAPLVRGPG